MKKLLFLFSLFLCALFGASLLFLQSAKGKAWIQSLAINELKKSGLHVSVGKVESALPHAIALKEVTIEWGRFHIVVHSLEARLSLSGLLQREILFTYVHASGISWEETEGIPNPSGSLGTSLPLTFKVERFQLSEIDSPQVAKTHFTGSLEIGKRGRTLFLQVAAVRPDLSDAAASVMLNVQRGKTFRAKGSLNTPSLSLLPLSLPFDISSDIQFSIKGSWQDFSRPPTALSGTITGIVTPHLPILGTPWKLTAAFQREENGDWKVSRISAIAAYFTAKGKGTLDSTAFVKEASVQIEGRHPEFAAQFTVDSANHSQVRLDGSASFPFFAMDGLHLEEGKAHIDATYTPSGWTGQFDALASLNKAIWQGASSFSWKPNGSLLFTNFHLHSPSTLCEGSLEVRPDWRLAGHADLTLENLQAFPVGLYGSLNAKTDWDVASGAQVVKIEGTASNLYWKELFSESLSFSLDLKDPFHERSGALSLVAGPVKWRELFLNTLTLNAASGGAGNWPFALSAEGEWEHPLDLHLNGELRDRSPRFICTLHDLSGSFYTHPLSLAAPVAISSSPDSFRLAGFDLILADAHLMLDIDREPRNTAIDLSLMNFPLDLLSLNPLEVAIQGKTNATLNLKQSGTKTEGVWKASVEQVQVESLLETAQIEASGSFEGRLQQDRLIVRGQLQTHDRPLLHLDCDLPFHLELYPLQTQILYDKPSEGHLAFQGRIEEMLDFFNLGTHRIEGDLSCDLTFRGALERPHAHGTLHFENGYYENYLTGTQLFQIQADGTAEEGRFVLHSLTATDPEGQGQLKAEGEASFNLKELFPFQFTVDLIHLHSVQIDLVQAETEGRIQVTGNLKEAIAQGQITVAASTFTIPDRIPSSLPTLAIVYKNPMKPLEPVPLFAAAPYPLQLNLNVSAPNSISISGRGLNSEWKGDFHIGGEYTSIAAKGKLELIKGQFSFAGRSFKLTDGALSFSGKEHQMPYLDLAGAMEVKGISITARLKGQLNNPQLTLQSSPQLPLSSLMAYLLFGQELSEINSFQALQIANSLASLSGSGPDVLESTRKSLGVDRLQVVSVPSEGGEEGSDTIALQVGKYISEGVLVSYTQGAEDASGNLSIEIELQHGLVIQLESDQRQEQGKFTFKWNHNY